MNGPRIIFWDLETLPDMQEALKVFPQLSHYPGLTLKATINSVICFGYKVYGKDRPTKCISAWDFKRRWRSDVNDDYMVVKAAGQILRTADLIVTFNGKRFDLKFLNTRLVKHKLPPVLNVPHVDLCALSKANLFLLNNRLNTVGLWISEKEKREHEGWPMWVKVHGRIRSAMREMVAYCKTDVFMLEDIFNVLKPFIKNIPNHNLFQVAQGGKPVCPACGSTRIKSHGHQYTKVRHYRRYRCLECLSFSKVDLADQLPRSF